MGLLPPVTQSTLRVPGRPGAYDFGNTLGERNIEIKYVILADSPEDLRVKARDFAKWVYTRTPRKLYILSEPDKYFWAKVSGESDLNELFRVGEGSFTFYCSDPFAYKDETPIDFNPTTTDPITIRNDGFFSSYPRLEFEFTQASTEFAVIANDEYLYFGQPAPVELPAPERKRILVLNDDCSSITNWANATGVDGGIVTGAIESTGNYFRQTNYDYGTGSDWHGGSIVRSLGGQQLQDFTIEAEVGFLSGYTDQVGRIEIYGLDINGTRVCKMALRDTDRSAENTVVEARAGAFSGGFFFLNSNVKKGKYKDFNGLMRISRKGKQWEFYIAKRDAKGRLYDSTTKTYFDQNGQFQQKIASVQIHFGAYAANSVVSTMYIEHLKVYEENVVTTPGAPPIIFEPGDKLIIDCNEAEITLNGEPFYHALDPSSSFIRLELGDNQLSISPPITTNGKIYYSQRWL
jgi:predicted phage tail component-like protein